MPKYKINIDKPLPSDKQIEQYKDFDSLYKEYQVMTRFQFWRDLYKKPRYFAGVAAAIAIAFLVHQTVIKETPIAPNTQNQQLSLENVTTPFQQTQVNANTSSVISLSEESQLTIPANAFVNAKQEIVSGEVELRYREIQESTDAIPTQQNLNVESYALLEVEAFQHGEKVFLAEDKSIEVAYITVEGDQEYNVYELNTTEKLWANAGKDQVMILAPTGEVPPKPKYPQLAHILNPDELISKTTAKKKPFKPFRIKAELSDFPELQPLEGINWIHDAQSKTPNPWTNNIIGQNWDDVLVKKLDNDRYEITFTRRDAESQQTINFQTIARPEYHKMDYAEAMEVYNHLLGEYETNKEEKITSEEETKEIAAENQKAIEKYEKELKAWEDQYGQENTQNTPEKYRRTFKVKSLGIHCVGKPVEASEKK